MTFVQLFLNESIVSSLLVSQKEDSLLPMPLGLPEDPQKDGGSNGKVRFVTLVPLFVTLEPLLELARDKQYNFTVEEGEQQSEYKSVHIGTYR